MNINEQFDHFLAELGVEMERAEDLHYDSDSLPEISIFQASRDHYGVFYRLDIVNQKPELRIIMPTEHGDVKMDIYLVRLSDHTPLNTSFVQMSEYEGSVAYEQSREAPRQPLVYAVAEMMKALFWSGDITHMSFPPEIDVYPVLLHTDRKPNRRKFR